MKTESKTFKLRKTQQCKTCPWRKDTNPYNIPFGYSVELHQSLRETIANDTTIFNEGDLRVMACHNSKADSPYACLGWLNNQLGIGNNIALRFQYRLYCSNLNKLKVIGEQHESIEDTLPK